jgi:hypothetical protein
MNAYLTRLGIRKAIQEWLAPHCYTNEDGHLCFAYNNNETEVFGLGFHRVPLCGHWQTENHMARGTIICSSAMEAIAWLNCHSAGLDHLLLVAGNQVPLQHLPKSKYVLVFGNDLPGRLNDLKIAAKLRAHTAEIWYANDNLQIKFRNKFYKMPAATFSLSAFERLSGFRFQVKTSKPTRHNSWLNQILAYGNY